MPRYEHSAETTSAEINILFKEIAVGTEGVVLVSPGRDFYDLSQTWWEDELLRLYAAFKIEEGHEPPDHLVLFGPNDSIVRFLFAPEEKAYDTAGMATIVIRSDGLGTSSIGVVEDVYVLPNFRGRGYATRLVEAVIEEAQNQGFICLELHSNPNKPGRVAAMRVYEKLGFKREDPSTGGTSFYRLKL